MKKINLLLTGLLLFATSMAFANETLLMVSIDKKGSTPSEIQSAVTALNFNDPNGSECFVRSRVTNYVPYTNASTPYYGVAFVDFIWQCDSYARAFLTHWVRGRKYTVWSNGKIGPFPAASGGN